MKNGYFRHSSPKNPEILQSKCKIFLSRLYLSSIMRGFYVLLVMLCITSILLNFLVTSSLAGNYNKASKILVIIEVSICSLIIFEIGLRFLLQGYQNCFVLTNIADFTILVLCIIGLILSLQKDVADAIGNNTCDTLLVIRNIIFLVRLYIIYKTKEENQSNSLSFSLTTEEKELVPTNTPRNVIKNPSHSPIKPKYRPTMDTLFEEEEDDEENIKNNAVWKGRKIND